MVYAGLLRVFPGLTVIGWLVVVGWQLYRHHRLAKHHVPDAHRRLPRCGGVDPDERLRRGKDSYQSFYKHTLEVHDRTPLTNHMASACSSATTSAALEERGG